MLKLLIFYVLGVAICLFLFYISEKDLPKRYRADNKEIAKQVILSFGSWIFFIYALCRKEDDIY